MISPPLKIKMISKADRGRGVGKGHCLSQLLLHNTHSSVTSNCKPALSPLSLWVVWVSPRVLVVLILCVGFPGSSLVKNLPASAGDMSSIPGSGGSPGGGHGTPFQYSCLENSTERGAGGPQSMDSQSWTRLTTRTHAFSCEL